MVEFINKLTGGSMMVAEDRVDEYLAAGHKLAASLIPEEAPVETPKKKAAKKSTTKKKTER